MGAKAEEVSIPLTKYSAPILGVLIGVEPALNQRDRIRERLNDYGHNTRISLLTGALIPAQVYYKAQKLRCMLRQQVHEALEMYDVLVLPTGGVAAQKIEGFDPVITSKEGASRMRYFFTHTFPLASAPAISVPCGFTSEDLPVGLQIGGRPFDEQIVLKVAHAYEQSAPWHTMRPPLV